MSNTRQTEYAAPKFYRELGADAVESYFRRKSCGLPTNHFTRIVGKTKYAFWKLAFNKAGKLVDQESDVDAIIKKVAIYAEKNGITEISVLKGLSLRSLNKPRTSEYCEYCKPAKLLCEKRIMVPSDSCRYGYIVLEEGLLFVLNGEHKMGLLPAKECPMCGRPLKPEGNKCTT